MSSATYSFLFTDIVGSTEHVVRLGDERWDALLTRYRDIVRRSLQRFNGREVDTAGDGFFALFESTSSAIRCALAIKLAVRALGLRSRTGIHTGACQTGGEKVSGLQRPRRRARDERRASRRDPGLERRARGAGPRCAQADRSRPACFEGLAG